jgi:hypothetical protein
MEPEDLIGRIEEKLIAVGVPNEVDPELIRPRGLHSVHRKGLNELETLLQNAIEVLKGDRRLPGILRALADLHLSEGAFGKAIVQYEICLSLNSEQVGAWVHMGLSYLMAGEAKDASN